MIFEGFLRIFEWKVGVRARQRREKCYFCVGGEKTR